MVSTLSSTISPTVSLPQASTHRPYLFTTCACFLTVQLVLLCTVNVETINSAICVGHQSNPLERRPFVRMIRKEDQGQTFTFSESHGWGRAGGNVASKFSIAAVWQRSIVMLLKYGTLLNTDADSPRPTGWCAFRWDYQATRQLHDCANDLMLLISVTASVVLI
jgi:hypothetical protein